MHHSWAVMFDDPAEASSLNIPASYDGISSRLDGYIVPLPTYVVVVTHHIRTLDKFAFLS
jgi:hypothetical protein